MPWANGRGVTVELRREDADGRMLWRLSRAEVNEDGPFSALPGVDRILTLIEGEGFDLDLGAHGGVRPALMLEPVAFSGDWPVAACRVRGPSRDLNLMVDRARARGTLTIHRGPFEIASTDRMALLALQGRWRLEAGVGDALLGEGELGVLPDHPGERVRAAGAGILAVAAVTLR